MSSRSSMYRRLMTMAGATALTVGGFGAILATGGNAFASSGSSYYTVGYPVSGVTFASTSSVSGAGANYTMGFVMPSNVSGASSTTIALSELPGAFPSSPTAIVTDTTTGTSQVLAVTSGSITLSSPTAGDNYTIVLDGMTNTSGVTTSTSYTPTITVASSDVGSSSAFTLTPSSTAAAATASATSSTAGASVTDTFSGFVPTSGSGSTSSTPYQLYVDLSAANQTYPPSASDYAVRVTTSGTTTTDAVTAVSSPTTVGTSGELLTLTLGSVIPAGSTVSVTIDGAINSGSTPSSTYVALSDSTNGGVAPSGATSSPTTSTASDDATFLSPVGLSATLAVNPVNASKTATWSTSFTVPSTYSADTEVTTALSGDTSPFTSWAVFDATNSAGDSSGTGTTVTLDSSVASGDSLTIDYYGVVNASSGSASASVELGNVTSADVFGYTTNSVSLTTIPTTSVNVNLSNMVPGAAANYTISGLAASSSGITAQTGTIDLAFPTGTVLPGANADYTVTDLSNSSLSGVYLATPSNSTTASSTVTINTQNTIPAGSDLQLTITGVINPNYASNVDQVQYSGDVTAAAQQVAAVPTAATTDPSGAFIQSGGQIDVVAGGHAFGIPNPTVFDNLRKMDSSAVVKGSFPTSAPASGTLINPVGTAGYWVVGTNGEIYQFSSMAQFKADGYSTTQVIAVPNAGGLTAGAGAPQTAAVTMANGALVQFGTTIYEYAGGVATGIQNPTELAAIQKMTGAEVLKGSGSTPTSATTSQNGTLVQPLGKAGIWVSNGGTLYQFMSASQFMTDGYTFAHVIPVATTGSYTTSTL